MSEGEKYVNTVRGDVLFLTDLLIQLLASLSSKYFFFL